MALKSLLSLNSNNHKFYLESRMSTIVPQAIKSAMKRAELFKAAKTVVCLHQTLNKVPVYPYLRAVNQPIDFRVKAEYSDIIVSRKTQILPENDIREDYNEYHEEGSTSDFEVNGTLKSYHKEKIEFRSFFN